MWNYSANLLLLFLETSSTLGGGAIRANPPPLSKYFVLINKNSMFYLCLNVARFLKNKQIYWGDQAIKKKYWKDEDFQMVWTRKWWKCGSDEKLLWLAFLPLHHYLNTRLPVYGRFLIKTSGKNNFFFHWQYMIIRLTRRFLYTL